MKLKYASLAIALIVVLLFATSCGKQAPEDKTAERPEMSVADIDSVKDAELKALITALPLPEPKQTSFDIIDKKLSDGKISEKDANTLRIIANFEPDALPGGYKAEDSGRNSYQAADIWLSKNWGTLDEDTRKILGPYYYERNDPRSHMNAPTDAQKIADALSVIPSVNAGPELAMILTTTITQSPERRAKIFYAPNNPAQEKQADWVSSSFVKSYPMFEQLLEKRPDNAVYVFLESMSSYGSAAMRGLDNQTRCRIRIKIGMDKNMTESTLAHELFHCFQFYIPLDYDPADEQWLMESTATWSEHYVYPGYNSEHEYLEQFFDKLNKYMMTYGLNHEYSTYVWHLFVTQYSNDPTYVKDVLLKAKTDTSKNAVTKDPLFNGRFAEYAVWNWNHNPYKRYADIPVLPGNPISGEAYLEYMYQKDHLSPEFEAVNPLGIQYHLHAFGGGIDKVTYTFEEEGDDKRQRAAFIKIGDDWHREDWTKVKERTFCRTPDDKMVKGVILISSNADAEDRWDYSYKIDTRGKCNPQWHGTVSVTWDFSNTQEYPGIAHQTYMQKATMVSNDVLVYDHENDEFLVKDQHLYYNHIEKQVTTYPEECGPQSTTLTNTQEGNAYGVWEIDEDDPSSSSAPERLESTGEEGEYDLILEVDPSWDWITVMDFREKKYKPCGLEGAFTPGEPGSQNEVYTTKLSTMRYMINPIKVRISDDRQSFHASETVNIPWGAQQIPAKVVADYWFG